MATKLLDYYNYCAEEDQEKDKFYRQHEYTEEEKEKEKSLYDRLHAFTEKAGKINESYLQTSIEGRIHYREGIGYISINNFDRDEITIYHYGTTEEEAYWNALIDLEFFVSENYELTHRKQLEEDYQRRFPDHPDGKYIYHGAFFFAELALQDFRKVYGENIPKEIIRYYENYASKIEFMTLRYDYTTNGFVKEKKRFEND